MNITSKQNIHKYLNNNKKKNIVINKKVQSKQKWHIKNMYVKKNLENVLYYIKLRVT